MADWALPVNTSLYTNVLDYLKNRDVDAGTLCYAAPTTPPTGMFKYVRADNKFQEWDGGAWNDKIIAVAGGGTGSATASGARTNLGLGSMATQASNSVSITGGSITGVSLSASTLTSGEVTLARGGTGASLALGSNGSVLQSNGSGVVFGTSGAALTSLNASNLASGTVPLARLSGITTSQMASANVSQFTNDAGYATTATASVPIGTVIDYAGPTPLPGGVSANYLICNGAAVSRVTYAALFAIIGTTYGAGDGVNTFNVPNCQQRSSIGADGTYYLGLTGGALSHTHPSTGLSNDTHSGHGHGVSGSTGAGTSHSHGSFTGSSGAGTTHYHGVGALDTAYADPPNHAHTFTTDFENVGVNDSYINEGDGNYGSANVVTGLTKANHDHSGTTAGVNASLSHRHGIGAHDTGGESSHTHGGGTYAVGNEASHTHPAGSLSIAADGAHSHVISGSVGGAAHAYIAFHKLIKYA